MLIGSMACISQLSISFRDCGIPAPFPTRHYPKEVSQPAIFVCSMAALEKLRMEKGDAALDEATCALGLSLGEYSALCFAGALSFEDGVKVTKARQAGFHRFGLPRCNQCITPTPHLHSWM